MLPFLLSFSAQLYCCVAFYLKFIYAAVSAVSVFIFIAVAISIVGIVSVADTFRNVIDNETDEGEIIILNFIEGTLDGGKRCHVTSYNVDQRIAKSNNCKEEYQ